MFLSCLYFHEIFTENVIPLAGDAFHYIYPSRAFYAQSLKRLIFPLWNPYEFAGLPFTGTVQTGAFYPLNVFLYFFLPTPYAFNASFLVHFALAGFFTSLYLRTVGLEKLPSVFGGAVFAFSGYMALEKLHTAILNAAVWLPLIMYLAEKLKRTLDYKYSLAISLTVAVQIFAGNFQICLYTYMVLALFFLFSLAEIEKGMRMRFALLCLAGISVGFLIAMPQILSAVELGALSMRPIERQTIGYEFFREFHVYLKTLPSLIFPFLYLGGGYGIQLQTPPDKMIAFVGILPLVLSVIVFLRSFRSVRVIMFWGVVGMIGLFLSMANSTPLDEVLFHVPVYNMFRAHGRNLFEFSFAVSVLSAFGVNAVISSRPHIKNSLVVLTTIAVVSLSAVAFFQTAGAPGLKEIISLRNPSVYVPLLIMAGHISLLGAYLFKPDKRLIYVLLVMVLAESYSFGAYYGTGYTEVEKVNTLCADRHYEFLKTTGGNEPFRAAEIEFAKPETFTSDLHNVPCKVGGFNSYDPLILKAYSDLFDLEFLGFSRYWEHLILNNTLLSMMNVRHLIVKKPSRLRIEDVQTVEEPSFGARIIVPGIYHVAPSGDNKNSILTLRWHLEKKTYLMSFKARAVEGKRASLRMEIYNDEKKETRYDIQPLHAYPGLITNESRHYYRVYHNDRPQEVNLSFISTLSEPVEIKDISIQEIKNYGPPPMSFSGRVYEKVLETEDTLIYSNRNALPRVYSITELLPVNDFHEVKDMFDLNKINPMHQALLYKADLPGKRNFAKGDMSVETYDINRAVIKAAFPAEGFLVFSDQYFPGWKAYVDGSETRIYRVNGILRGVIVPKGKHDVLFEYKPYKIIASIFLSMIMVAGILLSIFRKGRTPLPAGYRIPQRKKHYTRTPERFIEKQAIKSSKKADNPLKLYIFFWLYLQIKVEI